MQDAMRAPMSSDHDSRVVELRDLFRELDRVASRVDRFGWDHPATNSALASAEAAFVEALHGNANLVRVGVTAEGFTRDGLMAWIPDGPLEGAPARLFSAGIRALVVLPGVRAAELREWIATMMDDLAGTLGPDDDVGTALWDAALEHVRFEVGEGLVASDRPHHRIPIDHAQLDRATRAALARRLSEEAATEPTASFIDVLTADFVSDSHDARALLRQRIRDAALDLARRGGLSRIVDVYETMCLRIDAPDHPRAETARLVESAIFDHDVFRAALQHLDETPADVAKFIPMLARADGSHVGDALASLRSGAGGELRAALEQFIERAAKGREGEIARAIVDSPRDVAVRLLSVLSRVHTSAAAAEISRLSSHADEDVRLDAKLLGGNNADRAEDAVIAMMDAPDAATRSAGLRAIARHSLTAAVPTLLRRVRAASFSDLDAGEQRELLRALLRLSPTQGETVALEILRTGGIFQPNAKEQTRLVAIEILGEHGASTAALDAIRELGRTHWGASRATREAAERAARAMDDRAAQSVAMSQSPSQLPAASSEGAEATHAHFDHASPAHRASRTAAMVLAASHDALSQSAVASRLKAAAQSLADLQSPELAACIGEIAEKSLFADDARAVALVAAVVAASLRQLAASSRTVAECAHAALESEIARLVSHSNGPRSIASARSFGRLDAPASRRVVLAADSLAELTDETPPRTVAASLLAQARRFVRALAGRKGTAADEAPAVLRSMLDRAEDPEERALVALLACALDPAPLASARGTLEVTPFVHLLAYMLDHHASGSIELKPHAGDRRVVVFEDGKPTFIHPTLREGIAVDLALAELARLPISTKYVFYNDIDLIEGDGSRLGSRAPLFHALAAARAWPDRARMERMLGRIAHRRLVLHPHAHVTGLDEQAIDREILAALRRGARLPEIRAAHADALREVDTLVYVLAVMRQLSLPGQRGEPIG